MGKGAPSISPVDPVATANAQAAANTKTAQEQQRLNMISSYGPNGSVTYQADPSAPGGYAQTTSLSPAQQGIYNASTSAQQGALDVANQQIGRVGQALQTPLDPSNAGQLYYGHNFGQYVNGLAPGQVQSSFDQGGQLQYGYNPGQQVQGHVGPQDLTGAYQAAANASYGQAASRLDPQWQLQQNQLESKLANQGLSVNDDAYKSAQQQFNNAKTDAYNQANFSAQNQGLTAENTLFGQSLNQGQFANQAAAQQYAQNQGQAAFNNQTAGQAYNQNQGAAQFANSAEAQQFQQQAAAAALKLQAQQAGAAQNNAAQQQAFQQQAYASQLPINEFTALLGSGQVGMPTGIQYSPTQVNPTDVLGAYALNQQGQVARAQLQSQSNSGLMGGLMGLGQAAIMASDRRLKTDVQLIRRRKDGVGVYRFRYIGDPIVRVGVMAQELKKVRPDLVVKRPDGFLAVDYSSLDLEAA